MIPAQAKGKANAAKSTAAAKKREESKKQSVLQTKKPAEKMDLSNAGSDLDEDDDEAVWQGV
jgi:hypothetical protein